MKTLTAILLALSVMLFITCNKANQTTEDVKPLPDATIKDAVLTQGLSYPWEILWGPNNKLWITERSGKISSVDPSTGAVAPLFTISDAVSQGEGGLLGMALHPDFSTTPEVFVAYNYSKNGVYTEKIVKFTYNGTTLSNPVTLLDNIPAANIHNGCRLAISADKKLYISTGDAGVGNRAQDRNSPAGKILRINLDGTIPTDNPTPGSPLWSFGHRNPQGLVFVNSTLYSSEHGASNDDEINIIQKNRNFGWPTVEGLCGTSETSFCGTNSVAEPIYTWSPTIAPSGMDYYNSDAIPQWKNSLLLAVLKDSKLLQLKLNSAGDKIDAVNVFYKSTYGRMRDVCVAPDGKVYVITSNGTNDKIIKVTPN
jgi:aldose sugar dehydrogenase